MTMREQMARAIYSRYSDIGGLLKQGTYSTYDDGDPLLRYHCQEYANAALDALTNPTPEMISAAASVVFDASNSPVTGEELIETVFKSVIGAARGGL